jgi:flagellar motor switch protein FliN/FliY
VTPADALLQLGEAASAAVAASLASLGVEDVRVGATSTPEDAGSAFDGFELPVQAATVADSGAGRLTLLLTQSGATRLAAEVAGEGQPPDIGLIGEALSTLAGAAAAAVATRLGSDAAPAPSQARLAAEADPAEAWEAGAPVAVVSLTICEEPAALVIAVPAELLAQLEESELVAVEAGADACGAAGAIAGESLREVKVRLWAELGRTRMALGRAVGLAPGEVVELDAAVDDPVVIFVNGVRLGSGHLVVGDDGEWAFRVAEVSAGPTLHSALEGNAPAAAEHATVERKDA